MNHASKSTRLRVAAAADAESVGAQWPELRAKPLRRRVEEAPRAMPPVEPVIKWTLRFHDEGKRQGMLVVPGTTAHDRLGFYRKYLSDEWSSFRPETVEDVIGDPSRNWVDESILGNFSSRLAMAKIPVEAKRDLPGWFPPPMWAWEFIWGLASSPNFLTDEPLRGLVDQSHYLFHEIYRVLWELRFRVTENKAYEPTVQFFTAVVRWLTASALSQAELAMLGAAGVTRRVTSDQEQLDVLFFLITLAEHNALINRFVICFDGLERVLKPEKRPLLREMSMFLVTLDRWIRLAQAPVGVLIGMDTSPRQMTQLRKLNAKLADEVEAGLAWTSPRA
jgi:hypothetical protein